MAMQIIAERSSAWMESGSKTLGKVSCAFEGMRPSNFFIWCTLFYNKFESIVSRLLSAFICIVILMFPYKLEMESKVKGFIVVDIESYCS